jgi:hypothetical protein
MREESDVEAGGALAGFYCLPARADCLLYLGPEVRAVPQAVIGQVPFHPQGGGA